MAKILQEIITWFDANGNPTRVGSKVVVIRRYIEFGDGTVEIEEFVIADEDKVEKSLQGGEEDDFALRLPEDIESQFPIIPDGVEVIELSEELEKKLFASLISRVAQFFRGKSGFWVTTRTGKRVFIGFPGLKNAETAVDKFFGNSIPRLGSEFFPS